MQTLVDDFYNSTLRLLKSDWLKLEIFEDATGDGEPCYRPFACRVAG